MSRIVTLLVCGLIVISLTALVNAEVNYTGDGNPEDAGFILDESITGGGDPAAPLGWSFDTPVAGILTQDTTPYSGIGVSGSNYKLDETVAAAELIRANGWRLRYSVKSVANQGSDPWGLFLFVGDDVGSLGMFPRPTSFDFLNGLFEGYNSVPPIRVEIAEGEFHTVLIEMDPGGTDYKVSVDGVFAGLIEGDQGEVIKPQLSFGDGSSRGQGAAEWDYVRLPEPASLVLLGLGGLMLLIRKRRA